MSIFELTLEDTLARKNSNKIWFFARLFVPLQAKTMQKKIIKPIYFLTMKKLAYIFVLLKFLLVISLSPVYRFCSHY